MSKRSFLESEYAELTEYAIILCVLIFIVLAILYTSKNSRTNVSEFTYKSIPIPEIIDIEIFPAPKRHRSTTSLHLEDGSIMILAGMKSFNASDKHFIVETTDTNIFKLRRLCATDTVKTPSEFSECLPIL